MLALFLAVGPVMSVILAIVVLGLVVWLVGLTPIPPAFKKAVMVVAIVVLVVLVIAVLWPIVAPLMNF